MIIAICNVKVIRLQKPDIDQTVALGRGRDVGRFSSGPPVTSPNSLARFAYLSAMTRRLCVATS
jgi:hypothetical protein